MNTSNAGVVLFAIALLGGCSGTRSEKIETHAKPPGETIDDRLAKAEEERERYLDLPIEIRRSEAHLHATRAEVDRVRETPRDPWGSYEVDRRRVLVFQNWADIGRPAKPVDEPARTRAEEEAPSAPVVGPKKPAEGEKKPEGGGDKPADEKKGDEKKGE